MVIVCHVLQGLTVGEDENEAKLIAKGKSYGEQLVPRSEHIKSYETLHITVEQVNGLDESKKKPDVYAIKDGSLMIKA